MSSVLDVFKFRRKNTPLHTLDPRAKFAILVALSAVSLSFADPLMLTILLAAEALLLKIARSLRDWVRSLKGLGPIILLVFALNYIALPERQILTPLAMALRFLDLATAFSVFFLTTTPDELATALETSGVPREYTMMFTMSLRFVPSLARDLQTVSDALRSRGLELDRGNLKDRIRNYTYLLVPLIVYELRRSLMIAEALEARGFGAVRRIEPYQILEMGKRDYAVMMMCGALLAFITVVHLSGVYSRFIQWLTSLAP